MRLSNCEHPSLVYSKHTDSYVRVACGKCATCCNTRAKRWINRLDAESQSHRYTFMVTLTYDDEHLPSMFFSDDMEYLVSNRDSIERIPLHDLVELCKDEYGEYLEEDLDYLRSRLAHPLGLPVVCPKDLSNFFKRFNKYCFKHITQHYENFRYFATWEYGPTTYRPHIHLLVWFDDRRIESRFTEILHKTWSFGDSDASAVFSHGGRSYVAQYVNRPTHLPKVYSFPALRQKSQFSKCPSIGTLSILAEELPRFYYELPVKRTVWNSTSARFVTIPIDRQVSNRFFPKCPEYCTRSHFERVAIYGATQIIPSSTFRDFRFSLDSIEWCAYRGIASNDELELVSYFKKVRLNAKDNKSLTSTLYRWYSLSKRVVWYSRLLDVSLDEYVSQIEEFWKRMDYENLKSQLQFESDYVANGHSLPDLVHLFPEFSIYITNIIKEPTFVPDWVSLALQSFNISEFSDIPVLKDTHDFRSMSVLNNMIYRDSHKRKFVNTYRDGLLSQKDYKLSCILRKYQKFKNIYT